MNIFAAAESDLALRSRRVRRGGFCSYALVVLSLCAMALVTLSSSATADATEGEEIDWEKVKSTPPEEWSDELKKQIAAAGHDLDAIAERVRHANDADKDDALSEFKRGVIARAMAQPPEEWSEELKAAIARVGWNLEEFAESVRQRQKTARSRADADGDSQRSRDDALSEFKRGVVARAMAQPPEEWSEELKAAIARVGWNLEEFAEGIRQRQKIARSRADADDPVDWEAVKSTAPENWPQELKEQIAAAGYDVDALAARVRQRQREDIDLVINALEIQLGKPGGEDTSIRQNSWGRIKAESNSKSD